MRIQNNDSTGERIKRLGWLGLLIGLVMFTGCGGTMSVKYSPSGFSQPVIDKSQSELSIYVPPFKDNRSSDRVFWNGDGTNRPPPEILSEALLMELQRLGVKLTRNLKKAQGYIQGTLTTFNVADNFFVLAGDVKFSLELFKVDGNLSVWKHEFQGKASGSPTGSNPISSTLSTALNNSLNRLAYSEGFADAMVSLATQAIKEPIPPPL